MNADVITPDLTRVLRRLKLGRLLDTLPERLTLARQQQIAHQDFLLLVLSDEVARRDSAAVVLRATQAQLDPGMTIEQWDASAKVSYDRALWNEIVSMRFVADHRHVAIVGPVGVGKTFLAHALGWIACRHGYTVLVLGADKLLKRLKQARLDHTYEQELRKLLAVDVLILDDFGLDSLDPVESRDTYEILIERHRAGSIIVTSNRGPDEWLATFADPLRAQSAIDRFINNAYDFVVDGESYRKRQKPTLDSTAASDHKEAPRGHRRRRKH
jgi:DNA replication protein DnaC